MKISRFKYFLDDYSWLLKSVIVIALLLWAMQGHFLIQYMYQDIKNQIPRNLELERDLNKVLISFLKEMIEDAKLKGEKYGPGDYFNDLKRFKIKKYEIGNGYDYEPIFSNSEIARLQDCFISNTGDDRPFSYKDLDNARSRYSEWADRGDVCGDKFHSEIDNKIKKEGFLKTIVFPGLQWAWIGYCRGFFLVFLLFFIRMATRRGIIEIILADKKRFFFAIFLWPIFLLEYPHNVVKEIIVEVELRRIKSVFRSLSDKERMFIRKIATNSDFWGWLVIFQKEHRLVFQRSFAVALLAVFLIHLLPSISEARLFEEKRETPIISVSVEITENAFLNGNDIDQMQDDFDWGSFIGINQGISLNFFDKGLFLRLFKKIVTLRLIVKEIKHVPIGGCLFLY